MGSLNWKARKTIHKTLLIVTNQGAITRYTRIFLNREEPTAYDSTSTLVFWATYSSVKMANKNTLKKVTGFRARPPCCAWTTRRIRTWRPISGSSHKRGRRGPGKDPWSRARRQSGKQNEFKFVENVSALEHKWWRVQGTLKVKVPKVYAKSYVF